MSVPDIVLFPHCDLHVALHGAPALTLRVMSRNVSPIDPTTYALDDVTTSCTFDFFALYNDVGKRLDSLPHVDPATGLVTATTPGVYLFVVHHGDDYLTARLQVHDTILGWWFGNTSITTAKDARFAHAQPSLYALFSEDPSGSDQVGDITGHGYVALSSLAPNVFAVNRDGRVQGKAEGLGNLEGTLLTVTHTLPVRVVDYARKRNTLAAIRAPDIAGASEMHNIVFIAEGFRDSDGDRKKFEEIVTNAVGEILDKPRHAPYNLLEGSFNIWRAYEPSQQHGLTCGFRVNDEDAGSVLSKGFPIPYEESLVEDLTKYTVELLVRRVGLPLRTEGRTTAQLLALWNSQSLTNFDPTLVDDKVVTAWKGQKSLGILEARDTLLGFRLGSRPADRISSQGGRVPVPAVDASADPNLRGFVARVYEWFTFGASRSLVPDPRRHPPELFSDRFATNPGTSIMQYLSSLCWNSGSHPNIGLEWVPDPTGTTFKSSRGLVAVISQDDLIGGSNVCNFTMTANTLALSTNVAFEYANAGNERVMRRKLPDSIEPEMDNIIDTVAHEFGHSFNLLDEYEDFPGNDPNATLQGNVDFDGDNVARLAAIYFNGTIQANGTVVFNTNEINPNKVKWFDLLRIERSSMLIKDSETSGASIKITIDKRFIGVWVDAKRASKHVNLRARDITVTGQQLPLKSDFAHHVADLEIGDISEAQGTILLGGPALPPAPFPVFPKGSFIFIPRRDGGGSLRFVVEKQVLEKITATHQILNRDTDITKVNAEEDSPVAIADFKPPCKAYKLIGIYEGAGHYAGRVYRPAGLCKMRKQTDTGTGDGEFCHVCKYLIVNRINPGLHGLLDSLYYPSRKGD